MRITFLGKLMIIIWAVIALPAVALHAMLAGSLHFLWSVWQMLCEDGT